MSDFAGDDLALLLQRHSDLDTEFDDGDGGRFLSGWQCENNWAATIANGVDHELSMLNRSHYAYMNTDEIIIPGIMNFHERIDGIRPPGVFCTSGGTAICFMFCAALKALKISTVLYIPPLYFATHFALKLFGIRPRAVSGRQAFEPNFSLNLPDERSVLLLCDPVWYAGMSLPADAIDSIAIWQQKTGSIVFIDGSFQYSKWSGIGPESSACLNPELTVRLICPTKYLGCHGFRFAYALMADEWHSRFRLLSANFLGSAASESVAFGRALCRQNWAETIGVQLTQLVSARHSDLRKSHKIAADWQPDCGYFIFEKLLTPYNDPIPLMDGLFFEQKRYPEHRRINLLSPSISLVK